MGSTPRGAPGARGAARDARGAAPFGWHPHGQAYLRLSAPECKPRGCRGSTGAVAFGGSENQ